MFMLFFSANSSNGDVELLLLSDEGAIPSLKKLKVFQNEISHCFFSPGSKGKQQIVLHTISHLSLFSSELFFTVYTFISWMRKGAMFSTSKIQVSEYHIFQGIMKKHHEL